MTHAEDGIDWMAAARECDVVMKGGVTSGVIYPSALHEIARSYRLKGLGGTSAGAIGAALGAAAEYGRADGGFDELAKIPGELGADHVLVGLFQAQPRTRPLLGILLGVLALPRSGSRARRALRMLGVVRSALGTSGRLGPALVVLGAVLVVAGVVALVVGAVAADPVTLLAGLALLLAGILAAIVGLAAALIALARRLGRLLTEDVPANFFGVCTGHSDDDSAFTDWIGTAIDRVARRDVTGPPLTFGDLWGGPDRVPWERTIDLRMISTCLSQSRPYELPWEGRRFFYRPDEWAQLFPERVMAALAAASSPSRPQGAESTTASEWEWENALAGELGYVRFPEPHLVPVVVATRLSLSFPLLISAVPMHWISHASTAYRQAKKARTSGREVVATDVADAFEPLWFTDGGFTSNFPVHLFDAPLPTRPTFALDLEQFPADRSPDADEARNSFLPTNNREGMTVPIRRLPTRGLGALTGFATAAFFTSRDWQDKSVLTLPGFRDRIARIFLSPREGGLNLDMPRATIEALELRGRLAARKLVQQFDAASFTHGRTGWDNHRWIRYRALLGTLPGFLHDLPRALDEVPDAATPPSYPWSSEGRAELAHRLAEELRDAAELLAETGNAGFRAELVRTPRPASALRRSARL